MPMPETDDPSWAMSRRKLLRAAVAITAAATCKALRADQRFPDVVRVDVRATGKDVFDFDVTVSSPYDTPARYADGFRVSTPQGKVLGERKLWHDHQGEQPFTRDLHGLKIAPGIERVVVQARDQRHGYGGRSVEVALPRRESKSGGGHPS